MRRPIAIALLAAGLAVGGCPTRVDDDGPTGGRRITQLPEPGPELGQELMLGLALARNYHHKADVYLKEGRLEQAVATVRQILTIQFPADSPEGEDIQLDARAILSKLLVQQDKLDEAMAVVNEGIAGARRESFFLANLHTVRGEVLEARGARLARTDKASAASARREAIESYDRAIEIQKALIEKLAGEKEAE